MLGNEPSQEIEAKLLTLQTTYPLTVLALRSLAKIHSSFNATMVAALRRGESYWSAAEARCREILYLCNGDEARFRRSISEWVKFSFEFSRKQRSFLTTGQYAVQSFQEIQEGLYDNDEKMEHFYLISLMFSFLFSSNYVKFYEFFENHMLIKASRARTVCDVGCGHGVYLTQMLLASESSTGIGIDVSNASLAMTRRMLEFHRVATNRYRVEKGDLQGHLPIVDGTQDAVTCFEVIEHLEDPAHALAEFRRILAPGGSLCMSTAIRMESIDHIHLFRSPDEVRDMIQGAGLVIEQDDVIPLTTEEIPDAETLNRLIDDPATPLGYVAIIVRRNCQPRLPAAVAVLSSVRIFRRNQFRRHVLRLSACFRPDHGEPVCLSSFEIRHGVFFSTGHLVAPGLKTFQTEV